MPYAINDELPNYVPASVRTQWRAVFNACTADGHDEAKCFRLANGVAKRKGVVFSSAAPRAVPAPPTATDDELDAFISSKAFQYIDEWEYASRAYSQEEANYSPISLSQDQACSNCRWFVSPARCAIVSGVIAPNGLSDKWEATPASNFRVASVASVASLTNKSTPWVRLKEFFGFNSDWLQDASPQNYNFNFVREKSGRLRWYARVSNRYRDRDKEIFTGEAHKEYVEWADTAGKYPELWLWHTPKSRWGVTDWLDFDGDFLHASGLVDSDKEYIAKSLALSRVEVGVSHGFFGLVSSDLITKYRSFEISPLPRSHAAVWTTAFNTILELEPEMAFSDSKRAFLKAAGVEESRIAAWETDSEATASYLKELGVDYKGDLGELTPETGVKLVMEGFANVTATIKELSDVLAYQAATTKELKATVEKLEKSDDEKIATTFSAKAGKPATASEKNIIESSTFEPTQNEAIQALAKQLGFVAP